MKRRKADLTVHDGGSMKSDGQWNGEYEAGLGVGAGEMSGTWLMPFLLVSVREALPCGRELQEQMEQLGFRRVGRAEMCRTLRKMEKEGLVSAAGEEVELLEQHYRITDLGEAYLEFWANSLEEYKKEMRAFFEAYAGDATVDGTSGATVGFPDGSSPDGWQAAQASISGSPVVEDEGRTSKERGLPGVVFVMAGGGLRHMGGALDGFLGYPPERLLWRDVLELVHPGEVYGFEALLGEIAQWPGTSRCVEIQVRDVRGHWRPVEATVQNVLEAPIETDGGLLVVNMRDLSL